MPERMHFEFISDDDDPLLGYIETNLPLTPDGVSEHYASTAAADEGSYMAQLLSGLEGVRALTIEPAQIVLWREADADWDGIAQQVIQILREEFL